MTAEQRQKKLHDLNEQSIAIRNEMRELEKEQRREQQQECLKLVGRAFQTDEFAILVTSVPPIQRRMVDDFFNKYQFPCIKVSLKDYNPPIFDELVYIHIRENLFSRTIDFIGDGVIYEEIAFKEFQEILEQRIQDILKLAAAAPLRQQGKEIFSYGNGEICEN